MQNLVVSQPISTRNNSMKIVSEFGDNKTQSIR